MVMCYNESFFINVECRLEGKCIWMDKWSQDQTEWVMQIDTSQTCMCNTRQNICIIKGRVVTCRKRTEILEMPVFMIPNGNEVAFLICLIVLFILWICLFYNSVSQLSGHPTAPYKHHLTSLLMGKPFSLSSFPFFFLFEINPPGHSKLLCFPTVCLLCLSAAAHLFGFYSLCFSLGSVYAWLGPHTFKMMKGSTKCLRRRSFICKMCLWLLFPFVISSQQLDTKNVRGIWKNKKKEVWQVKASPADLFSPSML